MAVLLKSGCNFQILNKFLKPGLDVTTVPNRGKKLLNPRPIKRHPVWLPKKERVLYNEKITPENAQFIKEIVQSKYGRSEADPNIGLTPISPLKIEPIEPNCQWQPGTRRTGLIAKKIGVYPMWLKDGTKVTSTLLQIVDNHVIKYIPPEEFKPMIRTRHVNIKHRYGCLVVGAESADPQRFTKDYCGLFNDSGVMPKRFLTRFMISPEAALQPGTPLFAAHFRPGDCVDIRAQTIDRGFQGVCKRWGFKGMPASHGVTKTHRRPGNIGGGGEKGRVWPGTKLPGHMGNRWRVFRGIKILRVNTKYNVMWILGHNLPGLTNSSCFIYDSILPRRKHQTAPQFPTYLPSIQEEDTLPEELVADIVHPYSDPTITYSEQS